MAAEDPGSTVRPPQHPSVDDCSDADSRAEGEHDQVVATATGTVMPLSEQRGSGVVLDHGAQAELVAGPTDEIQ